MTPTTSAIVARYECHDAPGELYRVLYDDNTSLIARTEPAFQNRREFKEAVENHLDWANREPTPFVSTFADRRHALNWANKRVDSGRSVGAVVLTLSAYGLGHIFRVRDLVEHRGVVTILPESMYRDEYLVLREIDSETIINETDILRAEESDDSSSSSDSGEDEVIQLFRRLEVPSEQRG